MKWVIAELVNDEHGERWQRRAEQFGSAGEAGQWIASQPEPQRYEAREVLDGVAEIVDTGVVTGRFGERLGI